MTTPDTEQPEIPDNVKVITFKGHEFWVLEPDESQIFAISRLTQLRTSAEGMSLPRMLAAVNRVPNLAEALCARDEDKDWLEDAYLSKQVAIHDIPEFCAEVMTAWWSGQNRETRRAAAKKTAGARRAR